MFKETERTPGTGNDNFLSTKDLLARVPISRRTLCDWRLQGLPHIKIGHRVLFDWDAVRGWLLRQQRGE